MPTANRSEIVAWGTATPRRFAAHGMPVYAAALAYRGLLALVPLTLLLLALIGLLGLEPALPRLTRALARFRPGGLSEVVPLGGLLSLGAAVGLWSMSTGASLRRSGRARLHYGHRAWPLNSRPKHAGGGPPTRPPTQGSTEPTADGIRPWRSHTS